MTISMRGSMLIIKFSYIYNKFIACNFLDVLILAKRPRFNQSTHGQLLPTVEPRLWFMFATLLFTAGLVGIFFNNKNFLLFLLKLEVMFVGLNLFLLGGANYNIDWSGQAYALLIFGIVAAESVIGLSLFLVFFLFKKTIVYRLYELKQAEGFSPIINLNV